MSYTNFSNTDLDKATFFDSTSTSDYSPLSIEPTTMTSLFPRYSLPSPTIQPKSTSLPWPHTTLSRYDGISYEERSYLTPTCPSYNKLGPLKPDQESSAAMLRKFFSRPDDETGPMTPSSSRSTRLRSLQNQNSDPMPGSKREMLRRTSHESKTYKPYYRRSSSSDVAIEHDNQKDTYIQETLSSALEACQTSDTNALASSSSDCEVTRQSQPTRSESEAHRSEDRSASRDLDFSQPQILRHLGSSLESLTPPNVSSYPNHYSERSSIPSMDHSSYRCPACNRRCKSQASFIKHEASCTHRLGPLTLRCKFCEKPYTYIGYLHKHESECQKLNVNKTSSETNLVSLPVPSSS